MDQRVAQHHKIMRQVLEIRGCAPDESRRVQDAMRDTFYRHILPSLEKACSRLSTPGRLHRIGLLEVDLGEVPADALESAVAESFDRVFAGALAAAIASPQTTDADLDLEVYAYFVRTGTVPWWADRTDRQLLDRSLEALIGRDPRALRGAIESAPDPDTVWRRIALTHPDRLLDDLVTVFLGPLATSHPRVGSRWLGLIESVALDRGYGSVVARSLWWEELLRASSAGDDFESDAPRFFGHVLWRLSRRLRIPYGTLIADLCRAVDRAGQSVHTTVRGVVESIRQDVATAVVRLDVPVSAAHDELARLLARDQSAGRLDAQAWARVNVLIDRLPSGAPADMMARIRRMREASVALTESDRLDGSNQRVDVPQVPTAGDGEHGSPVDLRFSEADEIYVNNAGLIILWPFLENFFAHLDLLEARQFKDSASMHRAVGLLQYLAGGDVAPEYLVPLNKVLCGMTPEVVFEFGDPITDPEIDACLEMLTAAIHHAPILRDMSIGGFRRSFLLREGQLSVRDAHWLLRVERETHDIVLDRFPWTVSIVKLPWMAAMMQVEW